MLISYPAPHTLHWRRPLPVPSFISHSTESGWEQKGHLNFLATLGRTLVGTFCFFALRPIETGGGWGWIGLVDCRSTMDKNSNMLIWYDHWISLFGPLHSIVREYSISGGRFGFTTGACLQISWTYLVNSALHSSRWAF